MNFVELQKVMEEKGYNYSLDAIRQKVVRVHMILGFCMSFRRVLGLL